MGQEGGGEGGEEFWIMSMKHAGLVIWLISGLFLALALSVGCATKTSDDDIETIQTKDVLKYLADPKNNTVLLDVRSSKKFDAGHLPGAVNIPLPMIVEADRRLANAKIIIVYGSGWTDYLSPAGTKKLIALGYQGVYDYRGGVELWRHDGHAIEKSPAASESFSGQ